MKCDGYAKGRNRRIVSVEFTSAGCNFERVPKCNQQPGPSCSCSGYQTDIHKTIGKAGS